MHELESIVEIRNLRLLFDRSLTFVQRSNISIKFWSSLSNVRSVVAHLSCAIQHSRPFNISCLELQLISSGLSI